MLLPPFRIKIADACEWQFVWDQKWDFKLIANAKNTKKSWGFGKDPPPPIKKLRIRIGKDDPPTMSVCAVPDKGECSPIADTENIKLEPPDYCMLATGNFSVTVSLTETGCPVNVTIV